MRFVNPLVNFLREQAVGVGAAGEQEDPSRPKDDQEPGDDGGIKRFFHSYTVRKIIGLPGINFSKVISEAKGSMLNRQSPRA